MTKEEKELIDKGKKVKIKKDEIRIVQREEESQGYEAPYMDALVELLRL